MQIVYDQAELRQYLKEAVVASHEHPVLIDQYMVGREVEVDAISDGIDVCIPGLWSKLNVPVFTPAILLLFIRLSI